MKFALLLWVLLCGLVSSYNAASLTVLPSDASASGDEVDGPSNKAPITGHSLRVVIGKTGVSVGSLISVLLLICLVVGKRIRDRCDSASYPVKELEKRQRECGTPRTTIFINPSVDDKMENGHTANSYLEK